MKGKRLISCTPQELKKYPRALIYEEDVDPRHIPAETLSSEQHTWATHTQENTEKSNSRDIYALEQTSKGYGRTWGSVFFSDGHSYAGRSV